MKGIYLFANRARHPNHDIVYNLAMFTIYIETSATAYKYSVCSAQIRASHSLPGI